MIESAVKKKPQQAVIFKQEKPNGLFETNMKRFFTLG